MAGWLFLAGRIEEDLTEVRVALGRQNWLRCTEHSCSSSEHWWILYAISRQDTTNLSFCPVSTMPETLDRSSSSKKRKRDHAIESAHTVREEVENVTRDAGDGNAQSRISQLESQITESRRHYNNIAVLLSISHGNGRKDGEDLAAAVSLCRVFCRLMVNGNMSVTKGANDAEVTIVHWLKERYDEYLELLL